MKPRIVITIVTSDSKSELSIIEGRPMSNGKPSPGPTAKQLAIARKALRDLFVACGEVR